MLGQTNARSGDVLFQMFDFRRAGNRQYYRAALEQPGQRDLRYRRFVAHVEGLIGIADLGAAEESRTIIRV